MPAEFLPGRQDKRKNRPFFRFSAAGRSGPPWTVHEARYGPNPGILRPVRRCPLLSGFPLTTRIYPRKKNDSLAWPSKEVLSVFGRPEDVLRTVRPSPAAEHLSGTSVRQRTAKRPLRLSGHNNPSRANVSLSILEIHTHDNDLSPLRRGVPPSGMNGLSVPAPRPPPSRFFLCSSSPPSFSAGREHRRPASRPSADSARRGIRDRFGVPPSGLSPRPRKLPKTDEARLYPEALGTSCRRLRGHFRATLPCGAVPSVVRP